MVVTSGRKYWFLGVNVEGPQFALGVTLDKATRFLSLTDSHLKHLAILSANEDSIPAPTHTSDAQTWRDEGHIYIYIYIYIFFSLLFFYLFSLLFFFFFFFFNFVVVAYLYCTAHLYKFHEYALKLML